MDPCFETATRLARAIRNGRLSSVDATEAHLQRIARLNGPLNALVVVDRDGALKAARAADRALAKGRSGKKNAGLGALHGVPITIKEAFDVAGLATTSSHPPLRHNVARADASLVGRLRAAGAVILGKTNVPELCADFQTDSPLFGTTKNAWDERRTAGGSTGGGAVAVAARLSPLELGSDIGGSVRNPAHYNGIFALKPTEWRVPGRGHVPDIPGQTRTTRFMGVFGPLARSVEDLETALRIIAGPDGNEAEAPPVPLGPSPSLKARDLRIAVVESNPLVKVSADTASVVQSTVRLLAKAGAKVKRAEPEGLDWRQGWDDWSDLFLYQVRALQPLSEREPSFTAGESPDPSARSTARTARLDLAEFFAVLDRRDRIMRQCEILPRRLRRLADAGDARRGLHPPEAERAVADRRRGASVFFRRHVVQLSRQPDRPAVDRAALRFLARRPADRPAAHRQALGRGEAPGRRKGSGEAAAALSGAARLQGLSRHSTLTLAFSMIGFHLANSARW